MLGYTQPNNDVYIFFEKDDIERLERGKIPGNFINLRNPKMRGLLEVVITDEINDRIKTQTIKDSEGYVTQMSLLLRTEVHEALKERRTFELHEGFRHICLRDASQIDNLHFSDQANYQQLKAWESQQSD